MILTVSVKCLNEDCEWTGELGSLQVMQVNGNQR